MRLFDPALARWFRVALTVAIGITLWQTLTPSPPALPGAESDKLAHFMAFLTLTLLTDLSWPGQPVSWRACVLLAAFGAAIELTQGLIPNRDPSALDMLANLAGVVVYIAFIGPPLRRHTGCRT